MLKYYLKRPELTHRLRFERASVEYAKNTGRAVSTIRRRYHPSVVVDWPKQWEDYQKEAKRRRFLRLITRGDFDKLFDALGVK